MQKIIKEMDDLLWFVVLAIVLLILYRNNCFVSTMMTKIIGTSKYKAPLPLGTLGWPFIGETVDFVSCAYSDRPESFMDKRRRM